MIGSALNRIATAEKLSVGQLQEAIRNKTIPAYIGIPLLEEKMEFEQRMKNSAMARMAQAQQPSLGDQVMAAADAQSGIPALPSNLSPAPSMAGGGIVAFAAGGYSDDDDEEDDSFADEKLDRENEALAMRLLASSRAVPGMGAGTLGTGLLPPAEIAAAPRDLGIEALTPRSETPAAKVAVESATKPAAEPTAVSLTSSREERSTGLRVPSGHKYENKIVSEAERIGLDPKFALYLAGKETGGIKEPEKARSHAGALGIMQLMPGTARDMGVKDPFDPEQNIAGGLRYAKMMMDKYDDPKLAAIAYNWGPGNTDKWLRAGADMSKLPRETRQYVASLREGGAIRFQNRGAVNLGDVPVWENIEEGTSEEVMPRSDLVEAMTLPELQEYNRTGNIPPRLKTTVGPRKIGAAPLIGETPAISYRATTPKFTQPTSAPKLFTPEELQAQMEVQDIQEGEKARATAGPQVPTMPSIEEITGAGKEKAINPADELRALLGKRETDIAKRREQDKYMAILAAGLGMMGGTSRHAFQNIGQGALQGVAAMQASDKARAAEENALLSGRLGQYRVAQTEALRKDAAEQAQQSKFTQQLSTARSNMIKNIIAAKKMDINALDQSQLSRIEAEADAMLSRDPAYQAIYKRLYGGEFRPTAPTTSGLVQSAEERLKQRGLR